MHSADSHERLSYLAAFGSLMAFASLVVLCVPGFWLAAGAWHEACRGGLFGIVECSLAPFAISWAPFLTWSVVGIKAFQDWRLRRVREPRFSLPLAGLPVVSAAYLGASVEARGPEPVVAAGGTVVALVLVAFAVPFLQRVSVRAAASRVVLVSACFALAALLSGCGDDLPEPTVGVDEAVGGEFAYSMIEFIDAQTVQGVEPGEGGFSAGDSLAGATYSAALTGERLVRVNLTDNTFAGTAGIEFTFDEDGKDELSELTSGMVGRQLLIVLEGEVVSAPVVRNAVHDGVILLSGPPDEIESLESRLVSRVPAATE